MIHKIEIHVADVPGALNRIVTLISRRGYNITYLKTVPADRGLYVVYVHVTCGEKSLEQIALQIGKLIDVMNVRITGHISSIEEYKRGEYGPDL